jgi:hypothetical protein
MLAAHDGLLSFDTNVFDPRDGITEEQEAGLFSALASRRVRIPFQVDCFEECLLGLQSPDLGGAEKVRVQIRRLHEWCDYRRITKTADLMLVDDIRAYSCGDGPAGGFIEGDPHRWVAASLRALRNQSVEQLYEDWHYQIDEVRQRREHFRQTTLQTVEELRPDATQYHGIGFVRLWEAQAITTVRSLIESLEYDHNHPGMLEAVERRGFEGLLQIPSVRVLTGLTLSTMWEQLYGQVRGPEARRSDAADYRLAVCSTASDVFVTHDRTLFHRLMRIPALPVCVEFLPNFIAGFATSHAA